MTAKRQSAKTGSRPLPKKQSAGRSSARVAGAKRAKKKISATDRWVMISKNVYERVQRRGFVGGDPFDDLSEAAREVDEQYATDLQGLLALTDPVEMMEQFRSLFAGFGLGQRSLERLMEMYRDALEKLAESNRQRQGGLAERSARGRSLLQDAAGEAVRTLQSFTHSSSGDDTAFRFLRQPTQAVGSMLSRLTELANSATEFAAGVSLRDDREVPDKSEPSLHEMAIHGAVIKAYDQMDAQELADAPVAALKHISEASGRKLRAAFKMSSIRDMATNPLFEQAESIVDLTDAGQEGMGEIADGTVAGLEGITARQARVLTDVFRIRTVRDLAENRFFHIARAIVRLAECAKQKA